MAEVALKRRTALRGWMTRAKKSLGEAIKAEKVDKVVLLDAIAEFDRRLQALDDAQMEYELECKEEDINGVVEEAANFRDEVKTHRIRAARVVEEITQKELNKKNVSKESVDTKPDVKLPKLELPRFNGDALKWQTFWDQFDAIVHKSELPAVSKFTYLRSLLDGEAQDAIQGLALTERNYETARTILEERFGRKERIIFKHVQELLSMAQLGRQSGLSALRKLQDSLLSHVRSLETLGITGEQYGVLLTPIVLSCIPHDLRVEWARKSEGQESDLEWLLNFLGNEVQLRERSETFKSLKAESKVEEKKNKASSATAAALPSVTPAESCGVCARPHPTHRCYDLVKVNFTERRERMRNKGLCFKCLVRGHKASECSRKCTSCNGDHHLILCHKQSKSRVGNIECSKDDRRGNENTTVTALVAKPEDAKVILQTLRVTVKGKRGSTSANILFDTGSDRTYVSRELVDRVGPEFVKTEVVSFATFGKKCPSPEEGRNVYSLEIEGLVQGHGKVQATEIPVVCVPLRRKGVPREFLESFKGLTLAERSYTEEVGSVDILIGLDYYWKLMKPNVVASDGGLVAQETCFGWIVSGAVGKRDSNETAVNCLCLCDLPDSVVRNFWNVEEGSVSENLSLVQEFRKDLRKVDGRYEVALPWKSDMSSSLVDNFQSALFRLKGLVKKLGKDPDLGERYNAVLKEMEHDGIVEEVPPDEVTGNFPRFYLPHFPVVREASSSTKVRPVFDASAKGPNGLSLNDCLETGPNLIPQLVEILIRFRRWPVAVVADVKKAFLQISVRPADRDVHRFLWESKGVVRIMRINRVPFGDCSSPFLLNATVRSHLELFEASEAVQELKENLYVDDWLSGANTEAEAKELAEEAQQVMSQAGMELSKWESNKSRVVGKSEPLDFVKVLGLCWDPSNDCFMFVGLDVDISWRLTKRVILSLIARLFDPLGLLNPFTIGLKCAFQDLWRAGVEWDAEVPTSTAVQVQEWIDGLAELRNWKVPRCYFPRCWRDETALELHAFGDASEKAYGACVYLVDKSTLEVSSTLVVSRTKVAPLKRVSLPRLELLAGLVAAELVVLVREALHLPDDTVYTCWTDSMVALGWIRGLPSRWKQFVANRVERIQRITSPDRWKHCPGKDNLADLVTRGVTASTLMNSSWLSGPEWLTTGHPSDVDFTCGDEDCATREELRNSESNVLITATHDSSEFLEVQRWGSLPKSIRVVGWICRFVNNARSLKENRKSSALSYEELEVAKLHLVKAVQRQSYQEEIDALDLGKTLSRRSSIYRLSPFLGEDGLLRVQGRLDLADLTYDEKHPIIIPKGHLAKLFSRFQHVLLKHAGVNTIMSSLRRVYWIVGLRATAKRVKRECHQCQRFDSPACEQPVAPLPKSRVTPAPPFSVIGIDHAGPLFCSDDPSRKFYILLITCAVVRAVHLELVSSLNVEQCVFALRRFISRRGLPSVIFSDNAKTFLATQGKLQAIFGPTAPKWEFIVPRAPWWGGWWERLVKSVKMALRKSLGSRVLSRDELEVTLTEVEACVNSRPLTYVGDSVQDTSPLSPSHFLIGREAYEPVAKQDVRVVDRKALLDRKFYQDSVMNKFWALWVAEYLSNLPPWKGRGQPTTLLENSVVVVREDGTNRQNWPVGTITELIPGKDGIVRACRIKMKSSEVVRPVQRLHLIEVSEPVVQVGKETLVSRAGRPIKPVKRLDL